MNNPNTENRTRFFEIERTDEFNEWFSNLKNIQARAMMQARISRIEYDGFFGDTKGVGDNVSELRFHLGAGYRVYYTIQGNKVVFMLYGGDKSSKRQQQKDIKTAKSILDNLNESTDNENKTL
mgnify:FL=1